MADVVDASGMAECGPELAPCLDDIFTKFRELAEHHYGAHALWGRGNRFVALAGVQHTTDSSCIGSVADVAPLLPPQSHEHAARPGTTGGDGAGPR
eukprot:COSAG01_NODE_4933_length_4611_cov_20.932402_7_plen_96_part_00